MKLRDQGLSSASHPVSDELLGRIRRGANLSRRIALETLEILIEQGLLDEMPMPECRARICSPSNPTTATESTPLETS